MMTKWLPFEVFYVFIYWLSVVGDQSDIIGEFKLWE